MRELLLLVHRFPYPPDKGDKIRSWHFLRHLAQRYRVHLGCFIDDPRDWELAETLRGICAECCFVKLDPRMARLRSLRGLLNGSPLTVPYYYDARLKSWADGILRREALTHVFVYCSAMAQYVPPEFRHTLRCVGDLVDLDSEKWLEYSRRLPAVKAWVYAREGRKLRLLEREIAATFDMALLATRAEMELFRGVAADLCAKIGYVQNGVDAEYFSPERDYETPYSNGAPVLVFTGAMDYWPNIDAVTHFAHSLLPAIRERVADVRFYIVGSNPAPEVQALASSDHIVVTGRVPDVRPYVAHAEAVVAPLRIARGVQNKVLEGMAMAKPVIASSHAVGGIEAEAGQEYLLADSREAVAEAAFAATMTERGAAIGANARRRVLADYAWSASLDRLDAIVGA